MHINRVEIKNYRAIRSASVTFHKGLNVVVGGNEVGKSTLLEAINAALSGQIGGRSLRHQLHPYLFNQEVAEEYAAAVSAGLNPPPPQIVVEVYLDDHDELVRLKGSINSRKEDAPGVTLRIKLDPACADDFAEYVGAPDSSTLVPIEFFEIEWLSFANEPLSARRIPFKCQLIEPTSMDAHRGTGRYLSAVVGEHLSRKEQIDLSLAYRSMKLAFEKHDSVGKINDVLAGRQGHLSEKKLSVAMDIMRASDWDQGVTPLLDNIPFELVGKGEQSAARIWLAVDAANHADLVMVEEPENHLSYVRLNALIARMTEQVGDRQLIVTTHSSFVMNKLGLARVLMFNTSQSIRLTDLDASTTDFFRRLPGHDTLRLVLASKVILVEGPSDELVVQRAYWDKKNRRPIEDGVDVLCVRSLAFKRYLDIAVAVGKRVAVVTDNDGSRAKTEARYSSYVTMPTVRVCVSDDTDGNTLEPQLVAANDLATLCLVLARPFTDKAAARDWMLDHKTEAAIAIHDSPHALTYPGYIEDALNW